MKCETTSRRDLATTAAAAVAMRLILPWSAPASALGRRKVCVADAIVEADPVDPLASPPRIAVAQMNAPQRRTLLGEKVSSVAHRLALPRHAARLPLTIEPNVQHDAVIERRRTRMSPDAQAQHGRRRNGNPHREIVASNAPKGNRGARKRTYRLAQDFLQPITKLS